MRRRGNLGLEPRASLLDKTLLMAVVLTPFLLVLTRSNYIWVGLVPLVMIEVHFYRTCSVLFARSLFWPLFYAALAAPIPWPTNFIAPLALYLVLYWLWPGLRRNARWLVRGEFTRSAVAWMVLTAVVSSGVLLIWAFLFRPDLSDLEPLIPRAFVTIVAIGFLFSVCNAVWEEFILRGILWNSLEMALPRLWQINLMQGALFGLIHFHGFPRGWIGVLLATAYGLAIGIIRSESRGLLAPVVTHFFADATIFLVLYFFTVGVLPMR